jgi:hypothetical protein
MTEWSNDYRELWQAIRLVESVEELERLAESIAASRQLQSHEISQLKFCVFERFKEATTDDPDRGTQKIAELVECCLSEFKGTEGKSTDDLWMDRHRRRELLRDWVEQYDEKSSVALIETIYSRMLAELRERRLEPACAIISEFGYGSEVLCSALRGMIRQCDSDIAWRVLNCLISCGSLPTTELWNDFLSLSQGRDEAYVVSAMVRLGDVRRQELLPQIAKRLESSKNTHALHLTLSFWAATASDDSNDDPHVMRIAWEAAKQHPMIVLLDSRLAPSLALPVVIPDMLNWLDSLTQIENLPFRCLRVHHGVEKCNAPNQLASWHGALSGRPLEIVRTLATSNVGEASIDKSIEASAKLYSCRFLLMSGYSDVSSILENAYRGDSDWYLHRQIAELSCGIQIVPLPEFVKRRIELEFDETGDGSAGFMETDTALKIALSNGTREAFDALLNSGYTFRGGVLLNWIDTLCSVAYELQKNGEAGVLHSLCANLKAESKSRHRQMAARALSFLGARRLLDSTVIPSVLGALSDESLPDYTRADLAHSLHALQFKRDDDATRLIADIAFKTDQPNLRIESALFLIRQDFLADYVKPLWNLIGWGRPVEIPSMSKDKLEDWKCIIVAELYLRSPEMFQDAVLQVLDGCDEDVCSRVCRILKRTSVPAPSIVEKLIQRLKRGMSPFGSPSFLFSTIGHMDPERLLSSELWSGFENWMIGAKLECIDALRECVYPEGQLDGERLAKLEIFCSDSSDAVRRAAVQAMAALTSVETFVAIWRSWAKEEVPLWRSLLAAEAIELLPKAIRGNHGDSELNFLRYHRFRKVRDRARETVKAAKEHDNAAYCREKLLTMAVGDNSEVLKLFPYGDTLAKIGNMEDHRILLAFLAEHQKLKLNARVWLQEIINQIGKRFSKQNHEISHEWNSIYDSFDGSLNTNIGKLPAKFNLWKQPAANYREPGTWGGTAVLAEELRLDKMMQLKDGTIFAEKRSSSYVVVNRVDGAIVNLQGSGDYPEKQPDDVSVSS